MNRLARYALLACALFGVAVYATGLITTVLNIVAVMLGAV